MKNFSIPGLLCLLMLVPLGFALMAVGMGSMLFAILAIVLIANLFGVLLGGTVTHVFGFPRDGGYRNPDIREEMRELEALQKDKPDFNSKQFEPVIWPDNFDDELD